jgi:CBS domain containing-hemolysin-like protein
MYYLVILTYPSVVISELITRFFSKKDANSVSREEISAMANIGAKEGIFDENENKIIQNLIKLKTLRVNEVMTPRVVMVSANEDMTLEEFLENKDFLYFSRIPIYKKNQENITGYIFRENVFEKLAESHENLTLSDLKREIVTVHDNKLLFDLWNFLLEKKEHIALVLDEYGGVDGIITMEDIIETLLGLEIIDEKDSISDMREYAKDRWEKRKMKYNKLNNND